MVHNWLAGYCVLSFLAPKLWSFVPLIVLLKHRHFILEWLDKRLKGTRWHSKQAIE